MVENSGGLQAQAKRKIKGVEFIEEEDLFHSPMNEDGDVEYDSEDSMSGCPEEEEGEEEEEVEQEQEQAPQQKNFDDLINSPFKKKKNNISSYV